MNKVIIGVGIIVAITLAVMLSQKESENLKSTLKEDNTTSESSEEVPIIGRGLQFKCNDFQRRMGNC
jgi:hypothetical protein